MGQKKGLLANYACGTTASCISIFLCHSTSRVYSVKYPNLRNTNDANTGGAKMDNTVHLTALGFTIGEHAAPPRAARRQRQLTLTSTVKAAKRAGADRVEIDPRSGRIVIPFAGAAPGESAAAGSNELDDWISKHADQAKGP
jgi:hypothetical protein